jgi:uncharacterized protein (UPF0332 family)
MAALRTRDRHLLFVSIAQKSIISNLRYGAHIERELGSTIDNLMLSICGDRFRLGKQFFKSATLALRAKPPQYRTAISRAYYSMYHSGRAVVYASHGGDDYEAHSEFSQKLPNDFPSVAMWRNNLREARLLRNKADYDPYPSKQRSFAADSAAIMRDAKSFGTLAEQYLRGRGCPL